MIYLGVPLVDVRPYIEEIEPRPFIFHVQGSSPPLFLLGFNFTDEHLPAGEPVRFVLDMFQRLVYSRAEGGDWIIAAQMGRIEEPTVSSPYRDYLPNFACADKNGRLMAKQNRDTDLFYLHHLSSGTVRLAGKKYAPIQSTYSGGELFLSEEGLLTVRLRGELRFDPAGRPLYLLGRRVSHDPRFFARHQDFFFVKNATGRNVFVMQLRSDSPFLAQYVDGRECHFDIKPIPVCGVFPEEWELTTDYTQAQMNYDLCLAPEAADGECFVKGEILCFRRRISFAKVPVYTPEGMLIEGEWQWAGYTYYEAVPYPEYFEPLRGQGNTDAYYFEAKLDSIEPADVNRAEDPNIVSYARLQLTKDSGLPDLHNEERVCRLCEYSPSRGVFYKVDEDGIRYPLMVTPDTSEGYGIPTATLHLAYDEVSHECTEVVEHKCHRMIRQGSELLLTAERECWRQCGKIEGTIPPDLGDPRKRPRRIIYIEPRPDVSGLMPDLTSLMSGTYFNLVTGQMMDYSEYRSALPQYPDAPDPAHTWNPGDLNRPDYDFLGFATYPDADEPLFMISGDLPIGSLFPVWQPQESTSSAGTYQVQFDVGSGKDKFFGTVPSSLTVKYGSELDLMGYGDEEMQAYGLHFGGWSTEPNFQTLIPRIVVTRDITLYAIWYSVKLPYDKPKTCSIAFGDGTVLQVNRSSVLRLRGFNPDHLQFGQYCVVGWNTVPNANVSLFHLVVREDVVLYPVWKFITTPKNNHPAGYSPEDPENPYSSENESSPYHDSNPYGVTAENNPYDQSHSGYPYIDGSVVVSDWSLFPSDSHDLYLPENVKNPYHPDNPDRIVLNNKVVVNPGNAYNPGSVQNPFHSDNVNSPYQPPPVFMPPKQECDLDFQLEVKGAARIYHSAEVSVPDAVSFQVMNGHLKVPLRDGIFTFRQQFLDHVPSLYGGNFKGKQTYCEDPHIPENEKLTLLVDNSDGIFGVPTGGLSSSGASCLFDWDIWVDYNYAGRFTGNSGLRSKGILLNLRPEAYRTATWVKASPRYFRMSREKEQSISIEIKADGRWECIPFWVKLTDGGSLIAKGLGTDTDLDVAGLLPINGGDVSLTVTKRPDAEFKHRLFQGLVFYPKRKLNGCAVELVLLDFYSPDQDLEAFDINKHTIDVSYLCDAPHFTLGTSQVQVLLDSSLTEQAACVFGTVLKEMVMPPQAVSEDAPLLPVILGHRANVHETQQQESIFFTLGTSQVRLENRESVFTDVARQKRKCVPYEPKEGISKIIIRPHFRTAMFYGWLRAFGFSPSSIELWNGSANKDKVLEASMTITPFMFCDSDKNAGNYCMRSLFQHCRNLKLGNPFTFTEDWQKVQTAGNDFMFKMFENCESLDQFPVDYSEPQHFISVGENFKAYKCYGCKNLNTFGTVNTEPSDLRRVGHGFEAFEYCGCGRLLVLPDRYNEITRLDQDEIPYDFQLGKFMNCTRLRTLPDRYRETLVLQVGDNYLAYKFSNSGLQFLPNHYAESLVEYVGKNCQTGKFSGCTWLTGLPKNYTELHPANMENNFIKWKFKNCPLLVVNAHYRFPKIAGAVNHQGVFEEIFLSNTGAPQTVPAMVIINGNSIPTEAKRTFGDHFQDHNSLPDTWKR